jgi:hypothetical protein
VRHAPLLRRGHLPPRLTWGGEIVSGRRPGGLSDVAFGQMRPYRDSDCSRGRAERRLQSTQLKHVPRYLLFF